MNSSGSFQQFTLGSVDTNGYLVDGRWLIDPGGWNAELEQAVSDADVNLEAILLTHAHYDHIAGIEEVRSRVGTIPIFCHERDQSMLEDPEKNMSDWTGQSVGFEATGCVTDLESRFESPLPEVLELPGHTPGGAGFHWPEKELLFSGDSLFLQSVGRTDLPGGDRDQLLRSIRQIIFSLPEDTTVYPGHGPKTTVGQEKRSNPFLR